MKNIKAFLALMLFSAISSAQINLEHQFDTNSGFSSTQLSIANLSSRGIKYKYLDENTKKLILYNTDYTIYKTIDLITTTNYFTVVFVTDALFDMDTSNIEFILWEYDNQIVNVLRENGTLLFTKDSVSLLTASVTTSWDKGYNTILKMDESYKLLLYDLSTSTTCVYSLPGSLPCIEQCGEVTPTKQENIIENNQIDFNIYPNPSKDNTKIDYRLPNNIESGEILIYTLEGIVIKRFKISDNSGSLTISSKDISQGMYFYSIKLPDGTKISKTAIVIH